MANVIVKDFADTPIPNYFSTTIKERWEWTFSSRECPSSIEYSLILLPLCLRQIEIRPNPELVSSF